MKMLGNLKTACWYLNAVLNGTPIEKMQNRYKDIEFLIEDDVIAFRFLKPETGAVRGITSQGEVVAKKVDLKVEDEDERIAAKRIADAVLNDVKNTKPLTPVE